MVHCQNVDLFLYESQTSLGVIIVNIKPLLMCNVLQISSTITVSTVNHIFDKLDI